MLSLPFLKLVYNRFNYKGIRFQNEVIYYIKKNKKDMKECLVLKKLAL